MSDPSPFESNAAHPEGALPKTEETVAEAAEAAELSAEELDEVSGAGLIYMSTGTSTTTVSSSPPPPPRTPPPPPPGS
ncbi:MAG TPA: hypothetical protein V6C84_30765 [Coleofasciculaceae cyanobacterium]|jgi:hypothetical protein